MQSYAGTVALCLGAAIKIEDETLDSGTDFRARSWTKNFGSVVTA
ncbi:MAG: hypothetical protein ACLTQL_01325 [Eisenbergiella sp.]